MRIYTDYLLRLWYSYIRVIFVCLLTMDISENIRLLIYEKGIGNVSVVGYGRIMNSHDHWRQGRCWVTWLPTEYTKLAKSNRCLIQPIWGVDDLAWFHWWYRWFLNDQVPHRYYSGKSYKDLETWREHDRK